MTKYQIALSHETVDKIMIDVLTTDYQYLGQSIQELENTPDLPSYKKQDLEDNRRFHLAMKTVLGYYLDADHYLEVVGEPLYD